MTYGAIDDGAAIAQIQHCEDSVELSRLQMLSNNNTSGRCIECGEKIPAARLKVIPNANRCMPCQAPLDGIPSFTFRNHYVP